MKMSELPTRCEVDSVDFVGPATTTGFCRISATGTAAAGLINLTESIISRITAPALPSILIREIEES